MLIQSNFIIKGSNEYGGVYFIVRTDDDTYDIYQQVTDQTKEVLPIEIKAVFPRLKPVPNSHIVVSILTPETKAFLIEHAIDTRQMNLFREVLTEEELIN